MYPDYSPKEIEAKWQQVCVKTGLSCASETGDRPKFYCPDFFPYPSGEGLHVGHCRNCIPTDVISRFMRMRGYNVLHPMGGFACSSWYFLRFVSPHYVKGPFEPEALRYWMPVDLYVGDEEHAVLHLLYAHFWTHVLADAALAQDELIQIPVQVDGKVRQVIEPLLEAIQEDMTLDFLPTQSSGSPERLPNYSDSLYPW